MKRNAIVRAESELSIERHLVKRVKARGGVIYKLSPVGRRGKPDRLVLLRGGRAYFIELKREGGKPEPHQTREHVRLWTLGFSILVLDSRMSIDRFFEGVPRE